MRTFFDRKSLVLALKGFAMGTADVIPGVSGGTIAFISGIYDQLLGAIMSLHWKHLRALLSLAGSRRQKALQELSEIPWPFLIPLGLGLISAILTMSRILPWFLNNHAFGTKSFFFGLVVFSAWIPLKKLRQNNIGKGKKAQLLAIPLILMAALGAFWLMSRSALITGSTDPIYTFVCGMIGICAMILPGVSGAYLMIIMGQYTYLLDAVRNWDIAFLAIFCAGCAVGILGFSRILRWLLRNHFSGTMAVLTGLMIGSLVRIWPFTVEASASSQEPWFFFLCALVGGAVVLSLEFFSRET